MHDALLRVSISYSFLKTEARNDVTIKEMDNNLFFFIYIDISYNVVSTQNITVNWL